MGIRVYKPTSPGRRKSSVNTFEEVTASTPFKKLLVSKKRSSGRNAQGKITIRHRGGGAKRHYRIVDFKRDKYDIEGRVVSIEYDPNRNARIALISYKDGEKRYVIAPHKLQVGEVLLSSKKRVEVKEGNTMPLEHIPVGMLIYNVELTPGKGAELGRSAGTVIKLMAVDAGKAHLKLPSGEVRTVPMSCMATIGQVSNPDARHVRMGKAGRKRYLGIKPTVRGKAMNPVDHPHGGGEGSQPIGMKHPKTPWGKPALGHTTRKKKKYSNKFIVTSKKKKRRK